MPAEHTQVGAAAYEQGLEEPPPPATYEPFAHEHPSHAGVLGVEGEEISDLDVLAEADAGDDDLLSANGERDSSGYPVVRHGSFAEPEATPAPEPGYAEPAYAEPAYADQPCYYDPSAPTYSHADYVHDVFTPPPAPPPEPAAFQPLSPRDDFAARLALDEEDEPPLSQYPSSATAAPADGDDDFDEPHNYTIPEDPDYENPEVEFDERHDFGRRGFELAADAPDPAQELDNALSTLDVDLNRLEAPLDDRRRSPPRARQLPGMPPERSRRISELRPPAKQAPPPKQSTQPLPRPTQRPETDDGVIIDFDDDD
jgi:hypothetical protein